MQRSSVTSTIDHVFYDVTLFNPNTSNSLALQATVAETRTVPLLQRSSDYYAAVSRFEIPTDLIPIFNFQTGAYKVTLVHVASGDQYQTIVPNLNTSPPVEQIYSIQVFLDSINYAFMQSYIALNTAHAGIIRAPPIMIYDSVANQFSILVDPQYISTYPYSGFGGTLATRSDVVQIWFNTALYDKFEGFPFNAPSTTFSLPSGLDLQIRVNDYGNNQYTYTLLGSTPALPDPNWPIPDWPTSWLKINQDDTTNAITDITAIVITTNGIPVQAGQYSNFTPLSNISTGGKAASLPILTDFYPDPSTFFTPSGTRTFTYNATLYRKFDMTSDIPLRDLDLSVFWVDKRGVLYPLYLIPGSAMNIKLIFIKKGLES